MSRTLAPGFLYLCHVLFEEAGGGGLLFTDGEHSGGVDASATHESDFAGLLLFNFEEQGLTNRQFDIGEHARGLGGKYP